MTVPKWVKSPVAFAVFVCLLALGLRSIHFMRVDIWQDEANEILICEGSWNQTLARIRRSEMRPPLRYFLLKFWLNGGRDTHYLRLPSLFFSVAAVGVFYFVVRERFDEPEARMAALVLACSSFAISSAHFCRSYSMDLFVTLLAVHAFLSKERRNTVLCELYFVASCTLAAYTTYFFDFVLLLFVLSDALPIFKGREKFARFVRSYVPLGLLTSPLALLAPEQIANARANAWHSSGADLSQFVTYFQVLAAGRIKNWDFNAGQNVAAIVAVVLSALGARHLIRNHSKDGWLRGRMFFPAWFVVPVTIIFLFSLVSIGLFTIRTMIVYAPAFYLLMIVGIRTIRPTWGQALALGLFLSFNVYSFSTSADLRYLTNGSHKAAKYLQQEIEPDEWVIHHTHFSYFPFRLYGPQLKNRLHAESVPWHWGAAQVPEAHLLKSLESLRGSGGFWYVRKMNDYKEDYAEWSRQLDDLTTPWLHAEGVWAAFLPVKRLRAGNLILTHYVPQGTREEPPSQLQLLARELKDLAGLYTVPDARIARLRAERTGSR